MTYSVSNHISFTIKLFLIRLFSCTHYLVLKDNCWLEKYLGCPVISLLDVYMYFSNEYIDVNYSVSNHISFTLKLFPIRLFSCMYYLVLKGNCWLEIISWLSCTVTVLKFQTLFSFCFQIKCWLLGLEFKEGHQNSKQGRP